MNFATFKAATNKISLLKKYDKQYHAGKPSISDALYDKLYAHAKKTLPKNKYFTTVGAPVNTRATKTQLPILVGSLDKVRPADVDSFYADVEKKSGKQEAWYTTPKLDGQSMLLHYSSMKLVEAWTRGDGMIGRDITRAARYIQGVIPALTPTSLFKNAQLGDVLVRGECVMHKSIFEKFYKDSDDETIKKYKNPRNLVVGLTNRIDVESSVDDLKRCTFVAYHAWVYLGKEKGWRRPSSRHKELLYLALFGFTTICNPTRYAPGHFKIKKAIKAGHTNLKKLLPVHSLDGSIGEHVVNFTKLSADDLVEKLRVMRNLVDIDLDGLVLEPLDTSYWHKKNLHGEARPPYAKAIKLDVHEQDSIIGKIKEVAWDVSKRGLLKPTVVLQEPLNFNGVDVTNITGNNARFIAEWGFQANAKLRVIRSGDVIPRIIGISRDGKWKKVDIEAQPTGKINAKLPTKCHECGTKLTWTKTRVDLKCENVDCPGRHGKSVTSFFTTLGVDNVASGVVKHLISAGYDSIPKILGVQQKKLERLEGYGGRKAQIVYDAIKSSLKDKPLSLVMHASGMFSSPEFSMGDTRLAAIVDHLRAEGGNGVGLNAKRPEALRKSLGTLKGLGPNGLKLFIEKLPEWQKFYESIREYHTTSTGPKTLDGSVIAFTGFRDANMSKYIMQRGGREGGVSKNCTVLFAASMGSTKCNKAEQLGIEIVPQSRAWDWLKKHGEKK